MPEKRAIVISDLAGGGAQRVVVALACDWLALGHDVSIITLSDTSSDAYELPSGITRYALNCTGASPNTVSAIVTNMKRIFVLRQAIKDSGADKVISFVAATNILTIAATRWIGKWVVISERNDPSRQKLGTFWEAMRRLSYRHSDKVSANSHQALDALRSYVPKSKLAYVPNNMPDWPVKPRPIPKREKLILAVGRLHRQKAYDRLIRIFAASRARALGWRMVILGEGEQRGKLEQLLSELELSDSLEMPGHQSDVQNWYKRAGVFIMLSLHEGTPNALIEAIHAGLPAMVSQSCGDAARYVEELKCGIVVDAEDHEQSSEALTKLLENESVRTEFSRNGRAGLTKYFGPKVVRHAWEEVLDGS